MAQNAVAKDCPKLAAATGIAFVPPPLPPLPPLPLPPPPSSAASFSLLPRHAASEHTAASSTAMCSARHTDGRKHLTPPRTFTPPPSISGNTITPLDDCGGRG